MHYTRLVYVVRRAHVTILCHTLKSAMAHVNVGRKYEMRTSMEVIEIAATHGAMFGAHKRTFAWEV